MDIHIIAIGAQMPEWVEAACSQYQRRISGQCHLKINSIQAAKRGKGADISRIIEDEGAALTAAVPARCHTIALDRTGKVIDSKHIASVLERCMMEGQGLAFIIGGPEGLSATCQHEAREIWSLSALTMAHSVARVVLAEQVYRAWSIVNNLPYHR